MRVQLNGFVASDEDALFYRWFGYNCFSPSDVRRALKDNPEGEELVLEVNSPGGDVMAGSEIYSVLRGFRSCQVRAEIQSLAASAASYLVLGCDRVEISPPAQIMIHLPSVLSDGNYHDHQHEAKVLKQIGESILNTYELRCAGRTDRPTLRRWMENETWLTAQEAVDAGLCDGVLYTQGEKEAGTALSGSQEAAGLKIAATAATIPSPAALRQRAEKEGLTARILGGSKETDDVPESGTGNHSAYDAGAPALKDDWRARGRLSLALRSGN